MLSGLSGQEMEQSAPEISANDQLPIVNASVTRSPTVSSKSSSSKRAQNFLKGKSRAAYTLNPDLEKSFSSTDTSVDCEVQCTRGCAQILKHLASIFVDVGRHNAKTHAVLVKSFPNPKKEDKAYRNLTGEL